jgi:flavin reductase (DIM6/NTAB) family NADH-FMN oxidoreductase RutF
MGLSFALLQESKTQMEARQVEFPLERAFTFVESGPVLLIATRQAGKNNLMTASCSASMGFEPSLGICLGPWNHSYAALSETGQCVVAVPPADLLESVVDIGNCSGREIDKFARFGLTALPAKKVDAPLVGECLFNLECRVVDRRLVASRNFFVLEGLAAWKNPAPADSRRIHAIGDGTFVLDGKTVDLRARMLKWQGCI